MPAPSTPTKRMSEIATMFGRDGYSAAWHFENVEQRVAELEAACDAIWNISMEVQADIDNGDMADVSGGLVRIAESAAKVLGR